MEQGGGDYTESKKAWSQRYHNHEKYRWLHNSGLRYTVPALSMTLKLRNAVTNFLVQ